MPFFYTGVAVVQRISSEQLRDWLAQGEPPPLLLDVREAHEYAYCHLPGSLHIPMQQIPERLDELDPQRGIVVICHHGIRSLQVAHYMEEKGFKRMMNLDGGIEAWALRIEPSLPRY